MTSDSPYEQQLARIPVRRRELLIDGSLTRYWEYGDADAPVTIIVVHGFRGDHHGLEPVIAQLPHVRFIAPDLPGFGESEPFTHDRHDVAHYAAWLRRFIAEVAPVAGEGAGAIAETKAADASDNNPRPETVILGHSFGSILVSAALAEPDSAELPAGAPTLVPDRLVLVNPIAAPALSGPRGILTRLAVFYYWLGRRLPERLGYALLRNRLIVRVMSVAMAKTRDRGLRRFIHDQHDRYFSAFANRQVVLEAFRASVSHDVSEFARDIRVPTLLIAAERDDITPVAEQRKLLTRFGQASLVVIPEVGHLIHYETPTQAAAAIAEWLADDATTPRPTTGRVV